MRTISYWDGYEKDSERNTDTLGLVLSWLFGFKFEICEWLLTSFDDEGMAATLLLPRLFPKKGSEKVMNDGFVSMDRLFNGWLPLITISPKPLTIPPTQNVSIVRVNSAKMGGLILMSSSSSNIIISLMQSRRKGKVSWDECLSERGP